MLGLRSGATEVRLSEAAQPNLACRTELKSHWCACCGKVRRGATVSLAPHSVAFLEAQWEGDARRATPP